MTEYKVAQESRKLTDIKQQNNEEQKKNTKLRSNINAAETEYAKYADMITDKKNNLELLSSKESELIERTKIAESVFDMFRQSGTDDVREKLIDVMYENQKLREENTTLKELLEKVNRHDRRATVKVPIGGEDKTITLSYRLNGKQETANSAAAGTPRSGKAADIF